VLLQAGRKAAPLESLSFGGAAARAPAGRPAVAPTAPRRDVVRNVSGGLRRGRLRSRLQPTPRRRGRLTSRRAQSKPLFGGGGGADLGRRRSPPRLLYGGPMFISVHWKKWFDQTSWSVGYCPSCDRTEAIRIGRVISTTSLYFIVPVSREVGAKVSCCDFCGREAKRDKDADVVDVGEWNYRDGITMLFSLCAPAHDFGPLRFSTEDEVISLLRTTTRATKYSKIDLNAQWLPPLIGAGVGAALGIFLNLMLSEYKDEFRVIFLGLLGGGFVGGLLGVLIGGILSCDKVARTTIEYNALKYDIDPDLLLNCATDFPGRIRRAVRATTNRGHAGDGR
jgi:hypothetical protein